VAVQTSPTNGTVTTLANGVLRYHPAQNFSGSDQFSYTVTDNQLAVSSPGIVTIHVSPVNDAPVAINDTVATRRGTAATIAVLLDNGLGADFDVDDAIVAGSVTIQSGPLYGTVQKNSDGTLTYTPPAGFSGTDQLQYRIADTSGALSNVATVAIVVNDPPVAQPDVVTTQEDVAVAIHLFASNGGLPDVDLDGSLQPSSIVVVQPPANGIVQRIAGDEFRYTPFPNFFGSDQFTYKVSDDDGAASNVVSVQINVLPVNDPPLANNDNVVAVEDLQLVIDLLQDNGAGPDREVDGTFDTGSLVVFAGPSQGTLENRFDGTVLYTPNLNFTGVDTFSYRLRDDLGVESNTSTVSITVQPVNLPPLSRPDTVVMNEDTSIVFSVLSGGDFDSDGTLVPSTVVNLTFPENGSFTNRGDGTFRFTPFANFYGTNQFQYTVLDNGGARSKVYEVLRETVDSAAQISLLQHVWTLQVTGSGSAELVVNGYHESDVESFTFEYSTNGTEWLPTTIWLTNAPQVKAFTLPGTTLGTIYVRAIDSNRSTGETVADRLFVDEMYVRFQRAPDTSLPQIHVNDVSITEESTAAQFVVTRSGDSSREATIAYRTVAGTATAGVDFTPISLRSIRFAPGQTQQIISVPILNDSVAESAETFRLEITNALMANLADGEAVATIAASDQPSQPSIPGVPLEGGSGDTDKPGNPADSPLEETLRIVAIQLGSSRWSTEFRGQVDPAAELPFGYPLPAGDAQHLPLPWRNLNELRLQFSQPIDNPDQLVASIQVRGVNHDDWTSRIKSVAYDGSGQYVTVTFDRPLASDKYLVYVADSLQGTAGSPLDGEWHNGLSTQSGDGVAGGAFEYRFNVLAGDVDQSGQVEVRDAAAMLRRLFSAAVGSSRSYSPLLDVNGDGEILPSDGALSRRSRVSRLPAAEPAIGVANPTAPALEELDDNAIADALSDDVQLSDEMLQAIANHRGSRRRLQSFGN
jgi:hypothetical protein